MKCFHCHKYGHFATNYPQKKNNKKVVGSASGEALASQFELDFSLIACMVSSVLGSYKYRIHNLELTYDILVKICTYLAFYKLFSHIL